MSETEIVFRKPCIFSPASTVVLFSACGGIRTGRIMPVFTAYFPVLAYGILGKDGLFMLQSIEDCITGERALLPELEQVVPIYSLSVAVLPTAKHWPDLRTREHSGL